MGPIGSPTTLSIKDKDQKKLKMSSKEPLIIKMKIPICVFTMKLIIPLKLEIKN